MGFSFSVKTKYQISALDVNSFKVGETYSYDDVVKVAKKFGNPDILHDSSFSHTYSPNQTFVLQRIPLSKLFSGGGLKKERPSDVMFYESGPKYDNNGKLTGGDEYWAQRFAKEFHTGDTAGPIIVQPAGSNFKIIDGRHRARAAFIRGEKDIKAFIGAKKDSVQIGT